MLSSKGSLLWQSLRIYQVYGSNTDVGKTIFTTLLCKTAGRLYKNDHTSFLKPVSTGPQDEADERCMSRFPCTPLSDIIAAHHGFQMRQISVPNKLEGLRLINASVMFRSLLQV
jgi:dethiobiotin synthetase/adenosylmethionine--8-amino-7-oxononanoate aminotransferase